MTREEKRIEQLTNDALVLAERIKANRVRIYDDLAKLNAINNLLAVSKAPVPAFVLDTIAELPLDLPKAPVTDGQCSQPR